MNTAFNMRFGSYNTDTFRVTQLQLEKGNRLLNIGHIMKNYIYVKDMHMFVMFWVVVYIIVILHLWHLNNSQQI